jgi:hypothetical protein
VVDDLEGEMEKENTSIQAPAAAITLAASKQTYFTIRLLVDRERRPGAYQAYAYFRWVDDYLDQEAIQKSGRLAFIERQKELIERGYRGDWPGQISAEEQMLVDLIGGDREKNSGLQTYIRDMMAVMDFDAGRRGRLISQDELGEYTRWLATAVTEAMHYFIGHDCTAPRSEARYLAVTGAHITHMLRDTLEDTTVGYFNIPLEFIKLQRIDPRDVNSVPYRRWVQSRVELARACFAAGRRYLAQVENSRCRLAGYAYTARFEGVLDAIEKDGYQLRSSYPECKSLAAGMKIGGSILTQAFKLHRRQDVPRALSAR